MYNYRSGGSNKATWDTFAKRRAYLATDSPNMLKLIEETFSKTSADPAFETWDHCADPTLEVKLLEACSPPDNTKNPGFTGTTFGDEATCAGKLKRVPGNTLRYTTRATFDSVV